MGISRLLLVSLLCVAGFAQTGGPVNVWTPRGPEGGIVGRPVIDPQNPGTLYVNAGDRVLKTTDAAGHWSDLSAPSVTVLAVDPRNSSTLYGAKLNHNALFKSTDGGLTWNPSGPLPCPCANVTFVIDPGNPSTFYAGYGATSYYVNGGVFKSTDGGATWSPAGSGLPVSQPGLFSGVNALAIDPRNPGTLYAATGLIVAAGGGLFKSTDGAMSWSPVNSGLPDYSIPDVPVIDPQNSNTLYVSAGSVFKSTDGGSSWVDIGFKAGSLVFAPQDSGALYAVSSDGIVKSTDGGGSWSVVLPGAPNGPGWWVAVTLGEGAGSAVYAGAGWRGIFKSSDGGSTWAAANSGLFATYIESLAIDPQNPRALYAGVYYAGLLKSTDGAASWATTPLMFDLATLAFDSRNHGTVYASTAQGVKKSIDGGQNWVQLTLDLDLESYWPAIAIDMQNPETIYAGGLKSADAGASWVKLTGYAGSLTALATDPQNAGTVYAGSMAGSDGAQVASISSGVLKSVDGGGSWSGANTLWQAVQVSTVAVDPTSSSVVYAQTTYLDCGYYLCAGFADGYYGSPEVLKGLGLYKSTDGGATWVKLDLPGGPGFVSLLGIDQQSTLYAGAPAGLVRSHDGGATWNALPTAGLISGIRILAIDPQAANHLFAGTGAGVFEITLVPEGGLYGDFYLNRELISISFQSFNLPPL